MMKRLVFYFFLIFFNSSICAQEYWESYIEKKDNGLMLKALNLNYVKSNYKYLLVAGINSSKCLKNGFPKRSEFNKLDVFFDSIATITTRVTKNRLVGLVTYQCSSFDVYYVKDTIGLREKFNYFFKHNYKNERHYINIKYDKKRGYYKKQLYPENDSEDFFINHQLLTQLVIDGDDLSQEREVRHWFYFYNNKRRLKFINQIKELNFAIDSTNYKKGENLPFELQVSRKDFINPKSISSLTEILKKIANLYYGFYDGWSAPLIIKD